MKTFESRFEWLVQNHTSGNKSEFARVTGKTPTQINDICKGRGRPTFDYLLSLNHKLDINLHWLLVGDGKPYQEDRPYPGSEDDFVYIPRYDVQASAGYGAFVESEQVVDHLAFRREWVHSSLHMNPSQLVIITASGDSMYPTIKDGDILLVDLDHQNIARDGLYIVKLSGTLMAKRIQSSLDGSLHIISDNPMYKELVIGPEKADEVETLGRVVWCGSHL